LVYRVLSNTGDTTDATLVACTLNNFLAVTARIGNILLFNDHYFIGSCSYEILGS